MMPTCFWKWLRVEKDMGSPKSVTYFSVITFQNVSAVKTDQVP